MREQQMANIQISWQIDRKTEREIIIGEMKETAREKEGRRISLIYIKNKKAVSKHNAERERGEIVREFKEKNNGKEREKNTGKKERNNIVEIKLERIKKE